ncbi:MAG TPA: hypothetical protein VMB19_08315 [Silvibacterium sp.]|nr:hypothetical protein [Silvibacterium sp.]
MGSAGKAAAYTSKDFQLEVLGQLAEMQEAAESLRESFAREASRQQDSKLLRFDGRTLIAIGAIALSLTGYVLQDARNTSKRDAEIETMKARVTRLEEIAATNTEGRVRTEVELGELRDGQAEIKRMIEAHDTASKKGISARMSGGRGEPGR